MPASGGHVREPEPVGSGFFVYEGGEALLAAVGFAGMDGALLGSAVEGAVGGAKRFLGGSFIAIRNGFAQAPDGTPSEGSAGTVAVSFADGLVPALNCGLMVSHRWVFRACLQSVERKG
jgi:hypothetical protein